MRFGSFQRGLWRFFLRGSPPNTIFVELGWTAEFEREDRGIFMHESAGRRELAERLEEACRQGVFPGCVAAVFSGEAEIFCEAFGKVATSLPSSANGNPILGKPVQKDTVYDLASLTKVLVTGSLVALDLSRGRLKLDDVLPATIWRSNEAPPRLRDLLQHSSGLAAHHKLYLGSQAYDRNSFVRAIGSLPLAYAPRHQSVYSDLGFILLGYWLEELGGDSLNRRFSNEICRELSIAEDELFFLPNHSSGRMREDLRSRIAPTEIYDPRKYSTEDVPDYFAVRGDWAWGEVHDDNAFVMGGWAGHAGLFGTLNGVLKLSRAWLTGSLPGVESEVWRGFWRPSKLPTSTRSLAWDRPNPDGSGSTGDALPNNSIGHLGFTGTSLWITPDESLDNEAGNERAESPSGRIYILLSNRVHPKRGRPESMRQLRRDFHRLAAKL